MEKEKISGLQLFYILIGFEFGTTIILGLGSEAKQDAWLVTLFAFLFGMILMGVFLKLSRYYPNYTLVQIILTLLGKFLGYPVVVLYIVYFIYTAGRACRDFGELIVSTILVETPIVVIIGSFVALMIYCLRGGFEVFGRMGEAVFPIFMLSLIIVWILLLTIQSFTISNLSPVLGNGIKPIVREVFPKSINFPFGETIIILMFLPFLSNKKNSGKVGFSVIFISGFLLTINSILIISVLGPEIYKQEYFPLLAATRLVSIADFLERFDAIIILMMVAGVFFKFGAWTYGAALGIAQIFHLRSANSTLLALGAIITPLSLLIGNDFVQHLEIGFGYIVTYVHTLLHIIIPIILLCIAFIRKKVMT